MKRYDQYKTTQNDWLGEVPVHWDYRKLGSLFIERKVKVSDKEYEPLSVTKKGILPQLADAAKTNDGDNRKLVSTDDFVINSRSDRKGSCGVSSLHGSVSLVNIVLTSVDTYSTTYIHYLMRSHYFSEEFYRNGRGIVADLWTTRYREMKSIMLPVPPSDEQEKIVRYLDWKVAEIDRLIDLKRKQIKVTEELVKRLISDAVTRGLNPNVSMQSTGIDWLGEVPAHWEKLSIRAISEVSSEKKGERQAELLSVYRDYGVIIKSSRNDNHNVESEDLSKYKVVNIGDLVLNKMKIWQGSLGVSDYEGVVSPAYIVCHITNDKINRRYLHHLLRADSFKTYYNRFSYGIRVGQWDMHYSDFKNLPIYLPPRDEQDRIVEYISEHENKLHKRIKQLKQGIEILQELKTRLISDAVTGKIDVRSIPVPEHEQAKVDVESIFDDVKLQEQES